MACWNETLCGVDLQVWGGYTLNRDENGTLRKVLETEGMEAVIGGPYYLDQVAKSHASVSD